MTPVDLQIVEAKKRFILKELALLEEIKAETLCAKSETVVQYAFCRSVQNAISAVIDIAQHIVTERTDGIPSSYSEAIEKLGELGVLDADFATRFSRTAKLRNVVVHLYENIDIAFLASLVPQLKQDLKHFLRALEENL